MATQTQTTTDSPDQLLQQILSGSASSLNTLTGSQSAFDLNSIVQQANELMVNKSESGKVDPRSEAAMKQAIAIKNANMDSVRGTLQKQEISLRQITGQLSITVSAIDAQVAALKKPTEAELQSIAQQEEIIKQCEAELLNAQQSFFMFRGGAVKSANEAIAAAKNRLAEIKTQVQEAVKSRMERASIDDSVQNFLVISQRTAEVMGQGAITMAKQAQLAAQTGTKASQAKIALTKGLETLDLQIADIEAQINNEKQSLSTIISGTEEYAIQEQKVQQLENQLVDLRGQRNIVFIVLQEKDKDIVSFKMLQEACLNLKATYLAWKASLESSAASNSVGWRTAIEVMRAGQSQESASDVSKATDKISQDLLASVAQYNIATQKLLNDKAKSIPIVLGAIFTISDAHQQEMDQQRKEFEDLIDQAKKNWPEIERLNFVE